jgi:hypothetical protein
MKTYILMKNNTLPITSDDIKVNDIYGIYQNRCKAFWECKVANLKIMNEKDSKNPELLESYVLKEINLETSEIVTSYNMVDRNNVIDSENNKFKIPTFYNDIKINSQTSYI